MVNIVGGHDGGSMEFISAGASSVRSLYIRHKLATVLLAVRGSIFNSCGGVLMIYIYSTTLHILQVLWCMVLTNIHARGVYYVVLRAWVMYNWAQPSGPKYGAIR